VLNKEYLKALLKLRPFLCYQILSEHFGENYVTMTHGNKVTVH